MTTQREPLRAVAEASRISDQFQSHTDFPVPTQEETESRRRASSRRRARAHEHLPEVDELDCRCAINCLSRQSAPSPTRQKTIGAVEDETSGIGPERGQDDPGGDGLSGSVSIPRSWSGCALSTAPFRARPSRFARVRHGSGSATAGGRVFAAPISEPRDRGERESSMRGGPARDQDHAAVSTRPRRRGRSYTPPARSRRATTSGAG